MRRGLPLGAGHLGFAGDPERGIEDDEQGAVAN
jgi:hypothetical protein